SYFLRFTPLPPFFPYTTLFRSSSACLIAPLPLNCGKSDGCILTILPSYTHKIVGPINRIYPAKKIHSTSNAINCLTISRSYASRSEEHTSELQSRFDIVFRLML